MIRALLAAWLAFAYCWRHRDALRVYVNTIAIYPPTDGIDTEWQFLQYVNADDVRYADD